MDNLSINDITSLLNSNGLSPLKKFGQNFIADPNIIRKIADVMPIDKSSNVLEIGPGLGSLTGELADRAKKVVCIEIDRGMVGVLNERFAETENVVILNADVLKTDLSEIAHEYFGDESFHACGNLPYYITAKTIIKLCESGADSMTVMVQKEVAERLAAGPGSRDYGSITASVAYYAVPSLKFTVSRNCFYPVPDVESAVIYADLKKNRLAADRENYVKIVRASFAQKRKTIFNNLCSAFSGTLSKDEIASVLESCGIKKETRAESLTKEDFALLSEHIFNK